MFDARCCFVQLPLTRRPPPPPPPPGVFVSTQYVAWQGVQRKTKGLFPVILCMISILCSESMLAARMDGVQRSQRPTDIRNKTLRSESGTVVMGLLWVSTFSCCAVLCTCFSHCHGSAPLRIVCRLVLIHSIAGSTFCETVLWVVRRPAVLNTAESQLNT